MRISGTEPSSVILSQSSFKYKKWCQKVPKQGKAKRDDVINPQYYNFNEFLTRKMWCSKSASNQPKSTLVSYLRLWWYWPDGFNHTDQFMLSRWLDRSEIEVPRDVRNSKVRKQDKFGRDWMLYKLRITYFRWRTEHLIQLRTIAHVRSC